MNFLRTVRMNTVEESLFSDKPRIESDANERKYDKDRKQIYWAGITKYKRSIS